MRTVFNSSTAQRGRWALRSKGRRGSKIASLSLLFALTGCSPSTEPAAPEPPAPPASDATVPQPPKAPEIRKISDIDFGSYSRDLARFVGIAIGDSMNEATPKIEAYFVPKGGEISDYSVLPDKEQTETSYSTFDAEGAKVILVERINMRDDAVMAQQFYAIGKKNTDGTETLIDYGMKVKCARGENKGTWGTELCP